jgi:Trk K+ transport system NAD-binding subunit
VKTPPGRRRLRDRSRRAWRAQLVYSKILWSECRGSVTAFLVVLIMGSTATWTLYDVPPGGTPLGIAQAVWATASLIFFQPTLAFPSHPVLEAVFFLIPPLSALIIIQGLVRFSVLMTNRKNNMEVWNMALASTFENHVIIAGMGKIGSRVARLLLDDDERLVCVERDTSRLQFAEFEEEGAALIVGNILSDEVFRRTNVEKAKCFMACTDDDLVNFETALKVRAANPNIRVVLRLFNDQLAAQMQDSFNISIVYSSSALAAPAFASAVYSRHIKDSFIIDGERFCIVHCPVTSSSLLRSRTHQEIERDYDAQVVLHKDFERKRKPNQDEIRVDEGDNVILIMPFRIIKGLQGAL